MKQIFTNKDFQNKTKREINKWIILHQSDLIGSAIFTENESVTSKIVRWAENWGEKDKDAFTPSHTGSIVDVGRIPFVFDMKPMKAKKTLLAEYLLTTTDTFAIVLRDFELDTKMFSANILEHEGEFYPFMSAIRCVFTKRQSKWRRHCSELHLRELQKQGILTELNPELAPDELLDAMLKMGEQ